MLRRPVEVTVTSGHLGRYHAIVRFRAYSSHSEAIFQESLGERPLSPGAVIQVRGNGINRMAANGQERTFACGSQITELCELSTEF